MARHEFGIMDHTPLPNDVFEEYEPEKYGCISVDDEYIEGLVPLLENIPTYFHSLPHRDYGLNHIGITLIPPSSCDSFADILRKQNNIVYNELCLMLDKAKSENKFVIHYGL